MTPPPVVCYHRIGRPLEVGVTRVSRRTFERHMRALADRGWRTLTLAEFTSAVLDPGTPHPAPRTFFLTFDDGYESLADFAYPVLAELGFRATTFLITDYVGRTNDWDARYTRHRLRHLDWSAVESWRGRGFDFASHTASHPRLTWLSDERVRDELGRSRETLVRRLGPDAGLAVAYPFGASDSRVANLARDAGYELGLGGVFGNGRPHELPRVPVYAWDRGSVPVGLRDDLMGRAGRLLAYLANRCAVGTTLLKGFGVRSPRVPPLRQPPSPSRGSLYPRRSSSP
ncbi:MAG TPA: polysaccharide deacetylase family protein [Gemmatimonadales bacterium]